MYCGKGAPGYWLCPFKGKKRKCLALYYCFYAEAENAKEAKEAQFHLW